MKDIARKPSSAYLYPSMRPVRLTLTLLLGTLSCLAAEPVKKPATREGRKTISYAPQPWGTWVEADFPFFSSILDARRDGIGKNNLTPRGIIIKLPHDTWACFDTDLLRISAVWRGKGVSDKALAPGSYHDPSRKTLGGQFPAPQPEGKLWLGHAVIPGWQLGAKVNHVDPRSPAPSPTEVGRGPIPTSLGQFQSVELVGKDVVLTYRVADATIRELWKTSEHDGHIVIERHLSISAHAKDLLLVVGARHQGPSQELETGVSVSGPAELIPDEDFFVVKVSANPAAVAICVSLCDEHPAPSIAAVAIPTGPTSRRWNSSVTTKIALSSTQDTYVIDHVALPVDNPWKRAVRTGDIQFLKDGTAVVVTLDGDVWLARGLKEGATDVTWRRFASGLHEPMTCAIRDEQIFVFDRNGIWRLRDTNGDGEADVHELFSNAFAQTADMREFPSTIRLAPKGEFVIGKGGQEATTIGKHNGSILRISADGQTATLLGYGFRQPNLSVNPRTGLVIASDQQGQYIPSTPLHIVKDGQFYGFLSDKLPKEKYPAPIAEPLTWIPHAVNASALSQVWLFDAKMGALNDEMVQICFNKPDLLRVLWNHRGSRPQASVVSIASDFATPPLNGSVNPADGQLYIAGFQIAGWGNTLKTLTGIERVRHTGAPSLTPREVIPTDRGILLRFDVALDPAKATNPDNYSFATWHYKRAFTYGSAQYKEDGKTGNDWLTASSAYLSTDGKSVFIGVPGLKPVEQLRIGWALASAAGAEMRQNAYTTPYEFTKFDPVAEGFGPLEVDLTPRAAAAKKAEVVSADEGKRLATMFGCIACHSVTDTTMINVGPTWKGLFGSKRDYVTDKGKKGSLTADARYLRESILEPNAKKHASFMKSEFAMPSFAGVLSDAQIDSIVLYIKTLK
jgi:glucose/arabinose dehydrogenase/mono/diheme cytochrome c family protein